MITIDFNSFWSDQNELKDTCIEFIEHNIGEPDKVSIVKEDDTDPDSSFSLYINFNEMNVLDFGYYDELMDFARENELYVIVYDHETQTRKGFWYDEDEEWLEQHMGDSANYPQ